MSFLRNHVAAGFVGVLGFFPNRHIRNLIGGGLVLGLLCVSLASAVAATVPLTGPRLTAALARPTQRSWTELPVRQVLEQLGAEHRVSIFLDRRVDPGRKTSLDALRLPLGETLGKLATMMDTQMVKFGSIVYIGPASTASWLPAVAEARRNEVRTMPDRGRAMLAAKSIGWDDLATPRELVQRLAVETGVPIGPIDVIPHDLWAAAELPRTTAVERLTLILSQFDKTFIVSTDEAGKPRLVIVDVPEELRSPALPSRETSPVPPRPVPVAGSEPPRPAVNLARLRIKRFAVKEKPVDVVVEYLARQWNLNLEVDRKRLEAKLQTRITVTKENATVSELLDAVLTPAGLKGRLDPAAGTLKIEAR